MTFIVCLKFSHIVTKLKQENESLMKEIEFLKQLLSKRYNSFFYTTLCEFVIFTGNIDLHSEKLRRNQDCKLY